jgi:putative PIN family toxin of toxin-antitoxin system
MRVLLDANIAISYLLAPQSSGTIAQTVEACFRSDISLLLPPELMDEILASVQASDYLRRQIPLVEAETLLNELVTIAEVPQRLTSSQSFSRDPGDNYLIVHGLIEQVDYLITGDKDLLVLKQVESMLILSPLEFIAMLAHRFD